jgi:acyl-CoA thioesterase-1
VVPADAASRPRGGPLRLSVLALAGALLLVGCAGGRGERARMLPRDPAAPVVYVALGDSTVEGIGASRPDGHYVARLHERLRAVYPRASVLNLGLGGATSADVVDGQLERAVLLRPQLVTLSVGPNDITGRVPVAEFERNVAAIFRRLTEETPAVVVANLLPDLALTPRFRGRETAAAIGGITVRFNEALARAARAHGVLVVDLYAASREELPRRPELIAADGYHPSDAGYARWAELVWAGIERRLAAR